MVILWGWVFLMSEVPLECISAIQTAACVVLVQMRASGAAARTVPRLLGIPRAPRAQGRRPGPFSSVLLSRLELNHTKVYEPYIRALGDQVHRFSVFWGTPNGETGLFSAPKVTDSYRRVRVST